MRRTRSTGWNGTGIRLSPWISTSGVSATNSSCGSWRITSSMGSLRPSSEMLGDLGLAQAHQVGRELIGDIAPRDPCHALRELGDHELAGDPQEPRVGEACRHLVLRREEGPGRELVHDAVERDAQHHFRSAGHAGRLRVTPALRGRGAAPTRLLVRYRSGRRRWHHRGRSGDHTGLGSRLGSREQRVAQGTAPVERRRARHTCRGRGADPDSPTGARSRHPARGEAGRARAAGPGAAPGAASPRAAPARAAAASRAERAPRAPDRATR